VIELDSHDAGSYRQTGWIELSAPAVSFNSIGAALAIGKQHALKTSQANAPWGRAYGKALHVWAREHGFSTMRASDRSSAIKLHENIGAITAWRAGISDRERDRLNTAIQSQGQPIAVAQAQINVLTSGQNEE
jgi:hypothetical protein